jgi:hypothetical protein
MLVAEAAAAGLLPQLMFLLLQQQDIFSSKT